MVRDMENINLNSFCEKILTGCTLEDKLCSPTKVDLNKFSEYKNIPDYPGRPTELAFNRKKSMKLPSVHMLDDPRNRGILMHFFLNHELLALEIMAMTLLKFPELPDSFKRGMLKTMKEEQEHAKLYIERMNDMGVELGDVYVNSFFWDCMKNMSSAEQYVTAMSLTFEQANLDFSLYYKNAFELCGDTATARVMEKVYKDEISHVSFGLKWFRKWKPGNISEWQSYVSALEFPLSPARAKGNIYDIDGRRKAGFNEDFIKSLDVTSFSRGRAPDVYIFNAFTESFIAQPSGFNRPQWGKALEEDLSILPLVFAGQDDLLYMFRDVSVDHLQKLKNMGFELPQIKAIETGEQTKELTKRAAGHLQPWGWSPEMNKTLAPLIKQNKQKLIWRDSFKNLFSKEWSLSLNKSLNDSDFSWQEEDDSLGDFCSKYEDVIKSIKHFTSLGWGTVCIKTPFGASGRNIIRFHAAEVSGNQEGQIKGLLKKQGGLLVEPWLERVADFSAHYDLKDKLKFQGITRLLNDEQGQYSASVFGRYEQGLPEEVLSFLHSQNKDGLAAFYKNLSPYLEEKLRSHDYRGPIGVDTFVYKGKGGKLYFRPVVEVNFRFTMGRVALELGRKLSPGKCGLFKIFSISSNRESETARNLVELKEERINLSKHGKWESGKCLLNEWHDEIKFPIGISVANSLEECFSEFG